MGLCEMYEWFLAVVSLHFKSSYFSEVTSTVSLSLSYIIMTYGFIFMLSCKNSTVSSLFFVILFQMAFITSMLSSRVYQGSTAHIEKLKLKAFKFFFNVWHCPATLPSSGTLQQCSSAIEHLTRIVTKQAPSLNQHSPNRRVLRLVLDIYELQHFAEVNLSLS